MTNPRPTAVVRSTLPNRSTLRVAVVGLIALAARSAVAQDEDARTRARAMASEGDAAFAAGRCDRAIPLWRSANSAFAAPTIELRVAHCQALIGHVVEAAATLQAISKADLPPGAPEPWVTAKQQAMMELPTLRARVATLVIVRHPTSAGPISEVSVDDAPVPPTQTSLPLDPGKHRVRMRSGDEAWEQPVVLGDGETKRLVASTTLEQPPAPHTPKHTVSYVLFGAGAVAAGVGAVFGIKALSDSKSLQDECGPDRKACPPDATSRITSLKTESLVADILIGGGVVLIGTGAFLLWRASQVERPPPRVRLTVTGRTASLAMQF
jgi:hypothetical protein